MATGTIHSIYASDPEFHELIEQFVAKLPDRLRSMRAMVAEQNTSELSMFVHQLRGACGSYGFDEMTSMAAELEMSLHEMSLHEMSGYSSNSLYELAEPIEAFLCACGRMTAAIT